MNTASKVFHTIALAYTPRKSAMTGKEGSQKEGGEERE